MVTESNSLQKIEARCTEMLNSPYLFRELPSELRHLRALLKSVNTLAREDVPFLIAEVKRLRAENRRLEADAVASLNAASPITVTRIGRQQGVPNEPEL